MPASMAGDFSNDLKALEAEGGVQINQGRAALWVSGEDADSVATAREMLQFYLSDACLLIEGLQPAVIDQIFADEDIGVLMAKPECVVALDEVERTAWICGKHN